MAEITPEMRATLNAHCDLFTKMLLIAFVLNNWSAQPFVNICRSSAYGHAFVRTIIDGMVAANIFAWCADRCCVKRGEKFDDALVAVAEGRFQTLANPVDAEPSIN